MNLEILITLHKIVVKYYMNCHKMIMQNQNTFISLKYNNNNKIKVFKVIFQFFIKYIMYLL